MPLILVIITILAFAMAGMAVAKPKCPDPPCNQTTPDGTMTPVGNTAMWESKLILETTPGDVGGQTPRNCGCSGYPNPQGQVGYVCHAGALFTSMNNLLHIELSGINNTPVKGREKDVWCPLLKEHKYVFNVKDREDYWSLEDGDPIYADPDNPYYYPEITSISRSYWYGMGPEWNDGPCYDGSDEEANCNVMVYTQAYFVPNDCTGRKCGRLVELEGWGQVKPVPKVVGHDLEFNPFSHEEGRTIVIEELTIYFRGLGRDTRVAECKYKSDDFGGNPPVFYTFPTAEDCSAQ